MFDTFQRDSQLGQHSKISSFLILFIFGCFNYGCSPAGVLATGGSSAMVVAEGERSLGTVIDDATIKVNIAAKFLSAGNNLFVNINTSVLEGRVGKNVKKIFFDRHRRNST